MGGKSSKNSPSVPVEVVQENTLKNVGAITLTTDHAIDSMLYLIIIVLGLFTTIALCRYFGLCLTGHERKKARLRDRAQKVLDDVEAQQTLAKADPNHGTALVPVQGLAATPKKGSGKPTAYVLDQTD